MKSFLAYEHGFDHGRFLVQDTDCMHYWLMKTEPEDYSWDQLVADKKTSWTGVRNFEARNAMRAMSVGDFVVLYHTGDEKELKGIARICSQAYADPTADQGEWAAIDLEPVKELRRALSLEEMRNTHNLCVMPVVERPRLSVHEVTPSQWQDILRYTKTDV